MQHLQKAGGGAPHSCCRVLPMKTIDQWALLSLRKSACGQSSVQNGPGIDFPLCWQGKAVVAFILAGCGVLLIAVGAKGPVPGDPWYIRLIPILILVSLPLAILLLLPGRIIIDSTGIRQRFWWRRENHIQWSDFTSVIHDQNDGSTIVYGKFGPPIAFSPYLVDQLRFDREVKAFSRTDQIPEDI
jgi:hypothetical protein